MSYPQNLTLVTRHNSVLVPVYIGCNGENQVTDGNMSPSATLGGGMYRFIFVIDLLQYAKQMESGGRPAGQQKDGLL